MPHSKRRVTTACSALCALGIAFAWPLWRGAELEAAHEAPPASVELNSATVEAWNEPDRELSRELEGIVDAALLGAAQRGIEAGAAQVSVMVQELGVEGALVDLAADRRMRPASNLKLATTAAALTLLGASACFETHFDAEHAPIEGRLAGDLVVRAGADPLYVREENGRSALMLEEWVASLRSAGVELVEGDLVLDLGVYAEAEPAPGWPSANQHWNDYCALASGFSINGGCVTVRAVPAALGELANVTVWPLGHGAALDANVVTSARGSAPNVRATVRRGSIKVRGEIPTNVQSSEARYSHPDPVTLFGAALQRALERGGVQLLGRMRVERQVGASHRLASMEHGILGALIPINRHSNNAVADQLFYKLGAEIAWRGDRVGGERAVRMALRKLGLDPDGWTQVDGSGLSRDNRVSARQLACLLNAVLKEDGQIAELYAASLAMVGESGTLSGRMRGTPAAGHVLAKTGFIGGTSALSGLAQGLNGRPFIFSILVNYPTKAGLNSAVWKPMQDSICVAIVRHG